MLSRDGASDAAPTPKHVSLTKFDDAAFGRWQWLVRVIVEVAEYKEENRMGLRNLTLVIAPNLLVTGPPGDGAAREASKKKGTWMSRRAHGHAAGKKNERNSAPAPINPLEELSNIESASNALYTLCHASVRPRL